ncbi:hypothetical protein DPMN_076208 [Dreissena polymorpha]|uniref:Uncharacterized protein n=1 Tax=Dreissena polymorpha TaxID=45954 RepID=A0A9D3YLY3_DREPO|nr:hypothetical protein DPMN_076208 [Dreissena polymorpha]
MTTPDIPSMPAVTTMPDIPSTPAYKSSQAIPSMPVIMSTPAILSMPALTTTPAVEIDYDLQIVFPEIQVCLIYKLIHIMYAKLKYGVIIINITQEVTFIS